MIPITRFIPQYDPVVVWGGAFSAEECDTVLKLGEIRQFEKGRIGASKVGVYDADIRQSDITWIDPCEEARFIFERLDSIVGRCNFERFQLDLTCFDRVQYTKYSGNGHYDWHTDIIDQPHNPELHRKLSLSVILSDPEEYEGGELLFNVDGNADKAISLKQKKGDVVLFYSHIPHKVMPVTSGERVVLVTWIMGSKIC